MCHIIFSPPPCSPPPPPAGARKQRLMASQRVRTETRPSHDHEHIVKITNKGFNQLKNLIIISQMRDYIIMSGIIVLITLLKTMISVINHNHSSLFPEQRFLILLQPSHLSSGNYNLMLGSAPDDNI